MPRKKQPMPPTPPVRPSHDVLPTMTFERAEEIAKMLLLTGCDDLVILLVVEAVLSIAPSRVISHDVKRNDAAHHLAYELLRHTHTFENFCHSIEEMLADPRRSSEIYSALDDDPPRRDWLVVGIKDAAAKAKTGFSGFQGEEGGS